MQECRSSTAAEENMRKIAAIFLSASILFLGGCLGGCKAGPKYRKVDQNPAQTNSFQNGFNQESYIWEGWTIPKTGK